MGTDRKEISRVLSNPSNVILSDSLHDLLEADVDSAESAFTNKTFDAKDDAIISFDKETFSCKIKKIDRHGGNWINNIFTFVLFVPNLPIDVILDKITCILEISDYKFCLLDNSKVKWENNHITIKTRRILK